MTPGQNDLAAVEAAATAETDGRARSQPAIALGLALVTLLVFVRVVNFDFLGYDDFTNVYTNPHLNPVSWDSLFFFWKHGYFQLYMPVTETVWLALASVARLPHPILNPDLGPYTLNPHIFHAANLFFQILNVLLVYALLRCFVQRDWAAATGALLFGIHPVQAEPVAWITGFNTLLSGAFIFVALRQYTLFARADKEGRPVAQRRRHYAWATVAFALALLSKPIAVTVPLMAWTLDRGMIGRTARACTLSLRAWLVMALLCVVATERVQPPPHLAPPPLLSRPLSAVDALDFYLFKLFVPLKLCPHYGRTPEWLLTQSWRFLTVIPPLLLGVLIWTNRRRYKYLLAAACLFVLGVLPVLGLVPTYSQFFSTVTDRYLYLAMLGPALLLACVLERPRPRADGAAAIVLLMLGALCWRQVGYWRDTRSIFQHNLAINPNSWVAYIVLGGILDREGNLDAAIADYRIAQRLRPQMAMAPTDLGAIFLRRKQLDAAQASFVAALVNEPLDELARVDLGSVYFEKGQNRKAIAEFLEALRGNPESESANFELARALIKQGDKHEAQRRMEQVLAIDPLNGNAHLALGALLDGFGQAEEARSHYLQAVTLMPDSPDANSWYGKFLTHHGQAAVALPFLVRAVQLLPRSAQARDDLGVALSQQQRLSEAADQFSAAIALDPRSVQAHYNLGLTQAALGRPAQAVAEWRRALAIDGSCAPARQALARTLRSPDPEYRVPATARP